MPKRLWMVWGVLLAAALLLGSACAFLSLQPYATIRAWGDRVSKDGSLEMLTPERFSALQPVLLGAGLVGLIFAGVLLLFRKPALESIRRGLAFPGWLFNRLAVDGRGLLADGELALRLEKVEWLYLSAAVLLAGLARGALLWRPLEHDEAYTVVTFAISTLRQILSDYHLPNNHIFHTLQVSLSLQLFGYQPWAVRLPAFLAGVLLVPAVYLLARRLHDRWTAALAAGLAAGLPVLIYYGTNARGYSLLMLLTVVELGLAVYVLRRPRSLAAWALFVILAALGFWTVPVFQYPFGMLMGWIFLAAWWEGPARTGWAMTRRLVLVGIAVVALTLLLYSPVFFLGTGFDSVFGNYALSAQPSESFSDVLWSRMVDTGSQWLMGLPVWAGVLGVVGLVLALVLHGYWVRQGTPRFPVAAAALAWSGLVVWVTRPNPWPKLWTFAIPLVVIGVAAGWVGLLALLQTRLPARLGLVRTFVTLVICLAWAATGVQTLSRPEANPAFQGEIEQAAVFLKSQLTDHDLVVVNSPTDAVMWYYARQHAIHMDHFKRELLFLRVFVVVDEPAGQSVQSVMKARGPDLIFFDLNTARPIFEVGWLKIYELVPDQAMVRKEFHLEP